MEVGERIRQLRIHKRLTQKNLVKDICSITYLSRIENGQINPSATFLNKISNRLGVDLEDLYYANPSNIEKRILEIIHHYKEKEELIEDDLSYLHIQILEMHPTEVYLKIFGVLLRFYTKSLNVEEAKTVYHLSNKLIPDNVDNLYKEDYYYYYLACGNLFYSLQDYLQANNYYLKSEKLIADHNGIEAAKLYYNISLVKQRLLTNTEVSLYYSNKAYQIFNKYKDKENIIIVLITLGVQFQLINDLEKSSNHLHEALSIINEQDNSKYMKYIAMINYNLGRIHAKNKDLKLAIYHYKKSIQINHDIHFEQENIHALRRMIEIYIELKEWNMVNENLQTAIHLSKEYNLSHDFILLTLLKVSVYKLNGNDQLYEKEMTKTLNVAKQSNQYTLVKQISQELGEHFYDKKAYKKAADFYKNTLKYEEEIYEKIKLIPD
ncbi:helix-turn-helix transcriptional regulator [Bacillus spongiae]|uniref:Helix-turn-helix transcriptional regulator n=1 Tax=Bacillus spongiae TaxID=2683610 RepID=A0ABU8HED1_9BACI